ncbi:MAG: SGNH/GDSL hydrolase family protein [Rhodococcus sp. (in: high G+C Gram-positive bacteria)]
MTESTLAYRNRTGRKPGRTVRALSAVVPGVARVWAQVEPYADAWHAHNVDVLDRPGRRWIVLGDSLSQGIGASSYDAGWVGQLGRNLAARGHALQVVNLSATGARVRDVIDQQLPVLDSIGTRPDDVITVVVGSNDLFGGRGRRERLDGGFADLVDRVPDGTIVATLPQPTPAADFANAHIERAAAAGRIVMADLRVTGPNSWRGRLAGDLFHPNDDGYAAIATGLEDALVESLR